MDEAQKQQQRVSSRDAAVTVKDRERLEKVAAASKGHRGIVAQAVLDLTKKSPHKTTKGAIVEVAAPLIEATKQSTVQGGDYVTRYYVTEMKGAGILEVVPAPKPLEAAAPRSKKLAATG